MGRITGLVFTSAALLNTVQAPLLIFVNEYLHGDATPVQQLNLVLMLALVVPVWFKEMRA